MVTSRCYYTDKGIGRNTLLPWGSWADN